MSVALPEKGFCRCNKVEDFEMEGLSGGPSMITRVFVSKEGSSLTVTEGGQAAIACSELGRGPKSRDVGSA